MRLVGQIPIEVLELIASTRKDESKWPSIQDLIPSVPEYRYDEHMKEHVPNIPRRV